LQQNSNDRQTDGSPSPTNRKYKVFIPLLTEDDFGEIERNNFELFADRIIAQLRSLGFGAKAEAEGMGTVTVILTEEL
jgi:hypothetical protein